MAKSIDVLIITLIIVVCFSSFASAALKDGLIVYYPFDETTGTTASDASGNGNDAELLEGASWSTNGRIGGALRLDGSGSKQSTIRFMVGRSSRDLYVSWDGLIDDVRLYNRPLTQAEITTLASGAITDTAGVRLAGVGNLDTEMPSGSEDAVYTLRITNTGNALDTITLTTSGNVAATLSRNSVSLAPGASTDVILTIDEDALAEIGEYEVTVTATSQTDPTQMAAVTTNTTIFRCGVELSGVGDLMKTLTDTSTGISYTIRVTNIGSRADTVTLTTSGDVAATLSETTVALAAGASKDVTLTIAADALSSPGKYEVKVKATPESDQTQTAEITTTTIISVAFDVEFTGVEDLTIETTEAGHKISWTIRVMNTGNIATTVFLAASGNVEVVLSQTLVSLAQNASSDVTLTITEDRLTTMLTTPGDYQINLVAKVASSATNLAEFESIITVPQLPWDVNADGTVNILDLVKVANQFGLSGEEVLGDVNNDGTVNILDLVQVASHFGETQEEYALNNLNEGGS